MNKIKLNEQDLSDNDSLRSYNQMINEVDPVLKQDFFNPTMLLVLMMSLYPKDTQTNLYQAKICQAAGNYQEALEYLVNHFQ